jgi:hypothetical protein
VSSLVCHELEMRGTIPELAVKVIAMFPDNPHKAVDTLKSLSKINRDNLHNEICDTHRIFRPVAKIVMRFAYEHTGFDATHYTGLVHWVDGGKPKPGHYCQQYCLTERRRVWYSCSSDGEPGYRIREELVEIERKKHDTDNGSRMEYPQQSLFESE